MNKLDTKKVFIAGYCRSAVRYNDVKANRRDINLQKNQAVSSLPVNCRRKVKWYIDHGYSGLSNNRPALNRLLEDIYKGLVSTVCITDLNRLGRSYKIIHAIKAKMEEANINLVVAKD